MIAGALRAVALLALGVPAVATAQGSASVGIVSPPLDPDRPLYFYSAPGPGEHPSTATPFDSVTFADGDHFVGIATAPPWFAPEGLKLDYDLLWMTAETLTRDWVEVVVNTMDPLPRTTPRTAWVSRADARFRTWSEFLLEVHSVETLDPESNPLRDTPNDTAPGTGSTAGLPLRALAIRGDWMRVEGADAKEVRLPTGWIRWRADGRLLVRFSLLS